MGTEASAETVHVGREILAAPVPLCIRAPAEPEISAAFAPPTAPEREQPTEAPASFVFEPALTTPPEATGQPPAPVVSAVPADEPRVVLEDNAVAPSALTSAATDGPARSEQPVVRNYSHAERLVLPKAARRRWGLGMKKKPAPIARDFGLGRPARRSPQSLIQRIIVRMKRFFGSLFG